MGECLYSGKVKEVWSTDDPDILEFRYTNQISVFDQIIPSLIPRKGESLNRTTCHWFELVEKEGICRTHIVERNATDRCLVRRVDIYREPGETPRDGEWVFVPLEIVCRHYLAGSGWRRYKRGELTSEELGFEAGTVLEQGAKLPAPYVEVTTKFEAFDRLIDTEEALEIANITPEELDSLIDVVIKVDALIEREALKRGLIHVDGKKEFALGPGRVPVLVDSFGTLDEDRCGTLMNMLMAILFSYQKNLFVNIMFELVIKKNYVWLERMMAKTHQSPHYQNQWSMKLQPFMHRCMKG